MSAAPASLPAVQMWGGVECTVNRVNDRYLDQLHRVEYGSRPDDLGCFAGLGLTALRYPLLWERTVRSEGAQDWTIADRELPELQRLGVRPVIGLMHHGSGPPHTSLLDEALPMKLSAYARLVAARYPWLDAYTPVNEPLTTARFSALYGHWYPHLRDSLSCMRALLLQCRATVLAMRAIREVNPAAQLIQTEDLSKTRSTPLLGYQADFENERRWLTFDLLCGRVDRSHALWGHLRSLGICEPELEIFLREPCPPELIGLNYYVTSERFLDERVERYPSWTHGGNGRHRYADLEAVRVCADGLIGLRRLLGQAYRRYHTPLAVTEVHIGCSQREQLRWLYQQWQAAQGARDDGVDVRAVTAWALLGSHDWNSLVTQAAGHYEPGAFELSSGKRRATPLAWLIRALASGRPLQSPLLASAGWWQLPERLLYQPDSEPDSESYAAAA